MPGRHLSRLDADVVTPGLQATASIPRGGRLTATATVTMKLEAVTSANRSAPYRCTFDVSAVALDTAPEVDDAVNPENNTVQVDLEVIDRNDL